MMLDATLAAWTDSQLVMLWLAVTFAGTVLVAGVHTLMRRILR